MSFRFFSTSSILMKGVILMKKGCLLFVVILFLALCGASLAGQGPEGVLQAVVKIRSTIPKEAYTANVLGTEREGHGILIDSKGLIVTTGYLIVESDSIEVTGPDGNKIDASFVGYDHITGLGVLRAEKPLNIEPMKLGRSSKVVEGDPVVVAGYGGAEAVIGARVITRKEFTGYWEYILEDAIYTYPPYTNFGGAALIGSDGRLLGIGSLLTQLPIKGFGSLPCNVFIPVDLLPPILDDLIAFGRPKKPARPWLGINAEEAHNRVFITRITAGGPAEKAGLQPADLILKVNGKAVEGLADLYRKVWALGNPGVDATFSLLRGTEIRDITVQTGDRYKYLRLKPKRMI
jgi:S1-C subfamily serine protease